MNLFDMLSFDFGSFITSPEGIFMVLGIVCLLVGIILMFTGNKKKAKKTANQIASEIIKTTVQESGDDTSKYYKQNK